MYCMYWMYEYCLLSSIKKECDNFIFDFSSLNNVFHVIYAYWFSFDTQDTETCAAAAEGRKPITMGSTPTTTKIWALEQACQNLDEIRLDSLPMSFTIHLEAFRRIL